MVNGLGHTRGSWYKDYPVPLGIEHPTHSTDLFSRSSYQDAIHSCCSLGLRCSGPCLACRAERQPQAVLCETGRNWEYQSCCPSHCVAQGNHQVQWYRFSSGPGGSCSSSAKWIGHSHFLQRTCVHHGDLDISLTVPSRATLNTWLLSRLEVPLSILTLIPEVPISGFFRLSRLLPSNVAMLCTTLQLARS